MTTEGYVLHSYGEHRYLRHAVASAVTLRRYDEKRPIALFASKQHIKSLQQEQLTKLFDPLNVLPEQHQSIVGFKHHLHRFKPFDRSLFVDADVVWCRSPELLWRQLRMYDFTATGLQSADLFFGGPKGPAIVVDFLLNRRKKTLRKLGLTHLPRVQAGMIFAQNDELTQKICKAAARYLHRRGETHFRSRLEEEGRTEETCEWSLAAAMSKLKVPVYPWLRGYESPQLDFIDHLTDYDLNFRSVQCKLYCDPLVYSLRGIESEWVRDVLYSLLTNIPGKGDYLEVTPFMLHFGWMHEKQPFDDFASRTWQRLEKQPGFADAIELPE